MAAAGADGGLSYVVYTGGGAHLNGTAAPAAGWESEAGGRSYMLQVTGD